jgi:hypothetical protein
LRSPGSRYPTRAARLDYPTQGSRLQSQINYQTFHYPNRRCSYALFSRHLIAIGTPPFRRRSWSTIKRGCDMDWNRVEGNWKTDQGADQREVAPTNLNVINGKRDQLRAKSRSATGRQRIRPKRTSTTGIIPRNGDLPYHSGVRNEPPPAEDGGFLFV